MMNKEAAQKENIPKKSGLCPDNARIKICGLRRQEDILAVNDIRPDYCGFIIDFPKSFRSISPEKVRELVQNLNPEITPVGVFVNEAPEQIAALLNDGTISIAQLHGQETEEYIHIFRQLTDRPLIKAFSIRTEEDAEKALQSSADYILLDQGSGGTGQTFDWSVLPPVTRPWFLAGGLGPDNLAKALRRLKPWAVDLSSSVETDHYKDPEKIRRVVDIVRKYNTTKRRKPTCPEADLESMAASTSPRP